jgi:putative endopeptidase
MKINLQLALLTAAIASTLVQAQTPAQPATTPAPAGVNIAHIDRNTAPCDDFYRHAVGAWQDSNPIPADKPLWGAFAEIDARNRALLQSVIDEALLAASAKKATAAQQKIADFYTSGLNAKANNSTAVMALLDGFTGKAPLATDLAQLLGILHKNGVGAAFSMSVRQDRKNSSRYIVNVFQGGLGLPEREYYFSTDERSVKQREAYLTHMARTFEMLGANAEAAALRAAAVLMLETALAKASMTRVEARDPDKTYNLGNLETLSKSAPNIDWQAYFSASGIDNAGDINVGQPAFFQALSDVAKTTSLADWTSYAQWHLARTYAPVMGEAFAQESFNFYGKVLAGTPEIEAQNKRVIATIDRTVGELLGQLYVKKAFTPTAKAKSLQLVKNVTAALRTRIAALDWMSAETKKEAITKLDAINVKIGYPDVWKDYSKLQITADDYAGNVMRATATEIARTNDRLGKPIDRSVWGMSPATVNAYYSSGLNEIVFPAGILQPPFFDEAADDASNYGGIGMVIGHELTHGFDDNGRKFDAIGNRRDWWTTADAARYTKKADAIARQYDAYSPLPGMNINGRATLGENIADFGGLRVAFLGLQSALGAPNSLARAKIAGLTPEQRFFLNYGQSWRQNVRPEELRRRILTDSHSPAKFRILGPLGNLPEFSTAFGCKSGDKMTRFASDQVNVW